ncbi:ABC transporter permease [Hyphobacterium marinum]|uniref:ABC transporter permease n=1 Tax=Hyphobacterium marinum TaxID=3116574 RepID=A0ABU7LY61_9PROT|nr:ABC transporter permease [Hyphobacterium sp. Y6023]MEE2566469.1 ABC transporter permease [Hyphobacterium sp. Y6023]
MADEDEDFSFGGKTGKTAGENPEPAASSQPSAEAAPEISMTGVETAVPVSTDPDIPAHMVRDADAPRRSAFSRASNDLWAALSNWTLWWRLSLLDIRSRYRRTVIGPFWSVLSVAILVVALGFVYALLWKVPYETYLPYFAAGYVTWVFITSVMNEHAGSFIAGANIIRSMTLPVTLHIVRPLFKNILIFFHALTVYVVAALALRYQLEQPLALLLAPVGLVILSANLLWIGIVLAVLCSRFRDFIQVVISVLQIAFFITPIFWYRTELLQDLNGDNIEAERGLADLILANCNPFYHLVEVVRGPLIGHVPEPITYIVTLSAAVIGLGFALFILGRSRGRIAYWV